MNFLDGERSITVSDCGTSAKQSKQVLLTFLKIIEKPVGLFFSADAGGKDHGKSPNFSAILIRLTAVGQRRNLISVSALPSVLPGRSYFSIRPRILAKAS